MCSLPGLPQESAKNSFTGWNIQPVLLYFIVIPLLNYFGSCLRCKMICNISKPKFFNQKHIVAPRSDVVNAHQRGLCIFTYFKVNMTTLKTLAKSYSDSLGVWLLCGGLSNWTRVGIFTLLYDLVKR